MEQIERISYMENILDDASSAVNKLSEALEEYCGIQDRYMELYEYYGGDLWVEDFEADEAGKLPKDLKRGVLSEDAVYDLITDNKELVVKMLETAAESIKKTLA
ncbi:MAG: DUF4298 domain-containing protein [Lachnospiraceae bacterium]|nr:DUF4298 domain-containing protein [Lachnospiraceae bacterium]